MSVSNLGTRSFFHQPDPQRDIEEGKSEIFLETVSQPDYSIPDSTLELVREKIIDLNFQSKNTILRLGNIEIREKNTLKRYHWKVVTSSLTACLERGEPLSSTGLFLMFQIPFAFFLGTAWQIYLRKTSLTNDTQDKPDFSSTIEISVFLQLIPTIMFFLCIYPLIVKGQKPYVDRFAVLQHLTKVPNSLSQFHALRLTHQVDPTVGGLKPIFIEPMATAQLSASRFLCVGQYAIDMKNALSLIFQRMNTEGSSEELAHPIENRYLNESETIKFLNDVSAFFAISDSQKLLRCWRNAVGSYELHSHLGRIENWNTFSDVKKVQVEKHLIRQILFLNRIQEFLQLIPKKTQNEHFNHLTCHKITFPPYVTLIPKVKKEPSYRRIPLTPYRSLFEDNPYMLDE